TKSATAGLTRATLSIVASEPVRLSTTMEGTSFQAGPGEQVKLRLTGLTPGRAYHVPVTVTDLAGNTIEETITLTTEADLVEPTAPRDVKVHQRTDGTLAVTWQAAQDNAGIQAYEVLRAASADATHEIVARTDALQYIDEDVEPGSTYHYTVRAKDLAGRVGASEHAGPVAAIGTAKLTQASLAPETGAPGEPFTFRVVFSQPGASAPDEVTLVLDGTRIPMEPVEETAQGTAYRVSLPVQPHGPDGPHTYHFEARTDAPTDQVLRLPQVGSFEGPLVTVLGQEDGSALGFANVRESPIGIGVVLATLIGGAAILAIRRWNE
ncbi:MAG: fibronectin type III domain-containing protein, partial [Candidatus Thermoplasmatota archaeon]|nr:fibronectin type III domain-containing protein [Candidatus Thermoplasmatota archaeon]